MAGATNIKLTIIGITIIRTFALSLVIPLKVKIVAIAIASAAINTWIVNNIFHIHCVRYGSLLTKPNNAIKVAPPKIIEIIAPEIDFNGKDTIIQKIIMPEYQYVYAFQ